MRVCGVEGSVSWDFEVWSGASQFGIVAEIGEDGGGENVQVLPAKCTNLVSLCFAVQVFPARVHLILQTTFV